MNERRPTHADAVRRARVRTLLIAVGFVDMAIAAFFLGWGGPLLKFEYSTAWLIAAVFAASGVVTFFIATLAFGRKGRGTVLDEGGRAGHPPVMDPREDERSERARRRRNGFALHLAVYFGLMALLVPLNLFVIARGTPWFLLPMVGWGAALAVHCAFAMGLFDRASSGRD